MGNNGWYHMEKRGDIPKKAEDYEKKLTEFDKTRKLRKMQKSWIPSIQESHPTRRFHERIEFKSDFLRPGLKMIQREKRGQFLKTKK